MAPLAEGSGGPVPSAPLGAIGIEEASRMVGASPSALREWERQGLVRPSRTAGGARRYAADDIARLGRIRAWRTVEGLNAAAIRRLLDEPALGVERSGRSSHSSDAQTRLAPSNSTRPASGQIPGAKLREIRQDVGLTLREAAARSGLSTSFISSLERGVTGASLATLRRLVGAYGRTVGELLTGPVPSNGRLVRPHDRRVLDAGRGIRIEDLFAAPGALESQLFVLSPGASSDGYYRHVGEEFMFVFAGSLGVWLDNPAEFYRLEPGDALTFSSTVDHRIQALGPIETRLLWINTPPSF